MEIISIEAPHRKSRGADGATGQVGRPHVASLVWQRPHGEWLLTVVCKATFDLSPRAMRLSGYQAPIVREDRRSGGEGSSLFCPGDVVPTKPRVDVMVVGHCYAAGGTPVSSLVTRLAFGTIDKSIEVVGDQRRGGGRPQLFERMGLSYERASGGPDTDNPVGVLNGDPRLANLRVPGASDDDVAPIGFGPIAPEWRTRRAHLAHVDPSWSTSDPFDTPLPSEFDERFFNVAPVDQQLDEIEAEQQLFLEHLHPRHPRLSTQLPDLAPHAFVRRPHQSGAPLRMRADTVWIDTDRSLCLVTWRGIVPLASASDAGQVLVTLARAGDSFTPEELLAAREGGPTSASAVSAKPASRRPPPIPSRSGSGKRSRPPPLPGTTTPAPIEDPLSSTHQFPVGDLEHHPVTSTANLPGAAATSPAQSDEASPKAPRLPPGLRPQHSGDDPVTYTEVFAGSLERPQDASPQWLATPQVAPSTGELPAVVPPPIRPPEAPKFGPAPASDRSPSADGVDVSSVPPVIAGVSIGAALSQVVDRGFLDQGRARSGQDAYPGMVMSQAATQDDAPQRMPKLRAKSERAEITEMIWFEPTVAKRLRGRWAELVDELEFSPPDATHDLTTEEPLAARQHHNTFGVLTRAEDDGARGMTTAMREAIHESGRFTPPLVLISGTLSLPFSEVETLRATAESMAPLAPGDKRLKDLLDEVNELLATPLLQGGAGVCDGLTKQLREVFRETKQTRTVKNLESCIERALLDERRYQMRKVFGGTFVRSLLTPKASNSAIPTYLPESLAPLLPLATELSAKVIAEAHLGQDRDESHPHALRVLALGRVTPMSRFGPQ